MILLTSRKFYGHGKENSKEFWTFLETSMTKYFSFLDDLSSF